MAELKLCAHCGGKARACKCDPTGQWYAVSYDPVSRLAGRQLTHNFIMCEKCGIRTKVYATDKGAFNAWNRRVDRVKPIKSGHWIIEEKYIDYRIERCSECGFAARRDYVQDYWNYCPRCAADMRGGING